MLKIFTITITGITLVLGCGLLETSHFYVVEAQNKYDKESIRGVIVEFEGNTWSFEFGSIKEGVGKSCVFDKMPAPPSSFVISWTDSSGKKQKKVSVPEATRKDILKNRMMAIAILPSGEVTVQ